MSSAITEEQLAAAGFTMEGLKGKFEELSMEDLPADVKRRVIALKTIQKEHSGLEAEFEAEIIQLERKYNALYQPLYAKRADIVKGTVEPTETEAVSAESSDKDASEVKGIPDFWLKALKNNFVLAEMITEEDEEALRHLIDIRSVRSEDDHGYTLEFEFEKNEFFTNQVLSKKYIFKKEEEEDAEEASGDIHFDHSEGTAIDWIKGKNLTIRIIKKTQRHKTKNVTRTVDKEEPSESFFTYFSNIKVLPQDEEVDAEQVDEYNHLMSLDYEMGEIIKTKIVPEAVNWFLGLVVEDDTQFDDEEDDECCDGDDHDHGDDDDDDDEDEDEDEDEEEEDEPPRRGGKSSGRHAHSHGHVHGKANPPAGGRAGQQAPECKQQ